MTRASLLLSMLLVALLGQPAPDSAAAAGPARPTIELSLADTLRALPVGAASANASLLQDDGGSPDDPPIPPGGGAALAASSTETLFAFASGAAPVERRPAANRARAPPAP